MSVYFDACLCFVCITIKVQYIFSLLRSHIHNGRHVCPCKRKKVQLVMYYNVSSQSYLYADYVLDQTPDHFSFNKLLSTIYIYIYISKFSIEGYN